MTPAAKMSAPPVDRLPARLLRRHVRDLALELPALGLSSSRSASLLAMPKSTIFTSPVKVTTTFCGEMSRCTMSSGVPSRSRLLVRVREPRAHPEDDGERVLERELDHVLLLHLPHDRAEVLAVHVLHRDEVRPVDRADVEDLHDVRVRQRRGDARLVQQHLDERAVLVHRRQDALDDDELLEARRRSSGWRGTAPPCRPSRACG